MKKKKNNLVHIQFNHLHFFLWNWNCGKTIWGKK
jgi:hypothetical protein